MSMHTPTTSILVLPGHLGGQPVPVVDARRLHVFLGVGRDFSTWIKGRIIEYGFDEDVDYLLTESGEQVPHQGGWRTVTRNNYFLTLDMAKELAMVERTPRGREARRYFIDCERQLQQLRQSRWAVAAAPVKLSRAERQAINRQAWAEAAGDIQASFHARREALLRQYAEDRSDAAAIMPPDYRPSWAK